MGKLQEMLKGQKYLDSYNSKEVKEELIDVLHFWLSLCNDLNMTEEEIYNIYLKKNIVNHERLEKVVIEREE